MKILLWQGTPTAQDEPMEVYTMQEANQKVATLLGNVSDIHYEIIDGDFFAKGSIDMLPVSFHKPHRERIFSSHLFTFSRNIVREVSLARVFPFTMMPAEERRENVEHFVERLALIPKDLQIPLSW